jgi:hypothetical protein
MVSIHSPFLPGNLTNFLPMDVTASTVSYRGGALPGITFDRFVRACVVIKQLTESFRRLDTDQDGWIQINYDQFMETVLSLP